MKGKQMIRLYFELEHVYDDTQFSSSTTIDTANLIEGEIELDVIGSQFNIFLKQCGYYREYDNIYMESLSDEEYDAVTVFVKEMRENKKFDETRERMITDESYYESE